MLAARAAEQGPCWEAELASLETELEVQLARSKRARGEYAAAVRHYSSAIELQPRNATYLINRAAAQWRTQLCLVGGRTNLVTWRDYARFCARVGRKR